MRESKLIKQLKGLDKKELKALKGFLQSPYFNNSEDVTKLLEVISKYAPNYDSLHLKKEKVFKKVYSDQAFRDAKLRNLMSKLSRLIEKYLIQVYYEKHTNKKEKLLVEIYGKRDTYPIFKQTIQQLLKDLDKQSYLQISQYHDKHALSLLLYEHIETKTQDHLSLITNSLEALDQYYITERLRIILELKNREKLFSETNSLNIDTYNDLSIKTNSIHTILGQALEIQKNSSEATYFQLKETFLKHSNLLPKQSAIIILRLLLNYGILRVRDKELFFAKECFELYRVGLKNHILLKDGLLQYNDFINMTIFASKLGEYDWAETFLATYSSKLPTAIQENASAIASSFLFFFQDSFTQVIRQLSNFTFQTVNDHILAKTLLIRSYYKLQKEDNSYYLPLMSLCKAFENYIRRSNVIHESKKASYLNFLSFIRKLVQFDYKNANTKNVLLEKINTYKHIFAKSWLEEQIHLLEKG